MIVNQRDPWVNRLLGEQNFQSQKGFLPWWYRLTSSPEPENPTLKQRDLARRSKILSALALFLSVTLVLVAYIALTGPNKQIINTVYILYPTILVCLILNRFGRVNIAGVILCFFLVGGMYLTLITTAFHGGISPNDKDVLYLPFFGELVAAALLPPATIFLIATINVSFSIWILYYAPHTPAFTALLATSSSSIIFRVIEIHIFVTLVMWIMASWTFIAIKRADRAAEVARLEHDMSNTKNAKIKEKEALERSLKQIIDVHMQVANGHLEARVSVVDKNVLWQIAGPLNTLLSRYQQAKGAAAERELYLKTLNYLVNDDPSLNKKVTAYMQRHRSSLIPTTPTRRS